MWFSSSLRFGTNLKIYNCTYRPTEQKTASKILARLLLRVLQLGNRQTTPDIFSHQNRKRALGEGTVSRRFTLRSTRGEKNDGRRNARFGWDGAWRAAVFKPDEVDYRVIAALSLRLFFFFHHSLTWFLHPVLFFIITPPKCTNDVNVPKLHSMQRAHLNKSSPGL